MRDTPHGVQKKRQEMKSKEKTEAPRSACTTYYGQAGLEPGHSAMPDLLWHYHPHLLRPNKTPHTYGKKKKQMAEKEEVGKQGRVERHIKWTAWLAHPIIQVEQKRQKQRLVTTSLCGSSQQFFTSTWPRRRCRRQTPSATWASPTSLNCAISHSSSTRRLVSSATHHSAWLLASSNVRVPLLSHAMAAISCLNSGAKQQLLQQTSTGTGKLSSKFHPDSCPPRKNVTPASDGPNQVPTTHTTIPHNQINVAACLDKRLQKDK